MDLNAKSGFGRLFGRASVQPAAAVSESDLESRLLAVADRLRDERRWTAAVEAYAAFLREAPTHVAAWVQYGHALKEDGHLADATEAYRQAIALRPTDADAHLHHGHALKLAGRVPEATEAYRLAFELDPDAPEARAELIALGAREIVGRRPEGQGGLYGVARELQELKQILLRLEERLPALEAFAAIPVAHHHDFRLAYDVVGDPGPPARSEASFAVLVEAATDDPTALAATLRSLIGQTRAEWRATVLASPNLSEDRAGTFAYADPRIAFVPWSPAPPLLGPEVAFVLCLRAGVVLEPRALDWFAAAFDRTGAGAAICDYDHLEISRFGRPRYSDPRLLCAFDVDSLLQSDDLIQAPCLTRAAWDCAAPQAAAGESWNDRLRLALLTVHAMGPIAHIPRLLASRPPAAAVDQTPPAAMVLAAAGAELEPLDGGWVTRWPPRDPGERITVVIPTRDRMDLLAPCVESLRAHAADNALVDLVIVDNGSTDPQTLHGLDAYRDAGLARVQRIEETFNWSRLNNLAADAASDGVLLFLNDDVRMLTPGWDVLVRGYVQRPDVGCVGARLVYPDMRLQHAGVAMGIDGGPRHEGLGRPMHDLGPGGRWGRTRPASAVTGAFLAVDRHLFRELGGFDEIGMPIAYSDVDFCLKVRVAGHKVLYAPALTLIHAESQSRGLTRSARDRDWEDAEFAALHQRWSDALGADPAANPYWRPVSRPMETLHAPRPEAVWRWIDQTVEVSPWAPPLASRVVGDD